MKDCLPLRMQGNNLPVVKFLNGREEVIVPEAFSSEVHMQGTCKRTQVLSQSIRQLPQML